MRPARPLVSDVVGGIHQLVAPSHEPRELVHGVRDACILPRAHPDGGKESEVESDVVADNLVRPCKDFPQSRYGCLDSRQVCHVLWVDAVDGARVRPFGLHGRSEPLIQQDGTVPSDDGDGQNLIRVATVRMKTSGLGVKANAVHIYHLIHVTVDRRITVFLVVEEPIVFTGACLTNGLYSSSTK